MEEESVQALRQVFNNDEELFCFELNHVNKYIELYCSAFLFSLVSYTVI